MTNVFSKPTKKNFSSYIDNYSKRNSGVSTQALTEEQFDNIRRKSKQHTQPPLNKQIELKSIHFQKRYSSQKESSGINLNYSQIINERDSKNDSEIDCESSVSDKGSEEDEKDQVQNSCVLAYSSYASPSNLRCKSDKKYGKKKKINGSIRFNVDNNIKLCYEFNVNKYCSLGKSCPHRHIFSR